MTRRPSASIVANPILVGAVTALVVVVAIFLAYQANEGLPFVPSRSVHILYSELKPPQQPVTNYSGPGLQAYGYTLTEAIVQAWRGNCWHIDMINGLDDGTRYDFYIQLAQTEPGETFSQMWRDGIERQFELSVTRETRGRDVWVARSIGHGGPMLRYYSEAEPGSPRPLTIEFRTPVTVPDREGHRRRPRL